MSFQKLNILYVITSLRTAGAEKLVTELSLRLKEDGHEVEIFLMDGTQTLLSKQLEDKGVILHRASMGYCQMWNIWHYKKLKKLIEKKKFDIVHTHNTPAQIIAYLSGLSFQKKIRFITTEHNTHNNRRRLPLIRLMDKKLYSFYEKVICVSDRTKENLLQHLSLPVTNNKFVTITNGIDLSKFQVDKIEKPEKYKEKVIILMVAAFRKQKDQPTLIRALKYLPDKYVIWFAGDGNCRKNCEKLTKNLGLDDRVVFLGDRNDIPELYGVADIIVLASHYEGMSLSSIEGLVSGKPFIASDVDGLREIVKDYGVVFSDGDEKDLAKKIIDLAKNVENGCDKTTNGLSNIARFDIENTYREYKKIYDSFSRKK